MIIRGKTTKETLEHIYKTIHKHIKEEHCYYTEKDIQELKKDKKNIFYKIE